MRETSLLVMLDLELGMSECRVGLDDVLLQHHQRLGAHGQEDAFPDLELTTEEVVTRHPGAADRRSLHARRVVDAQHLRDGAPGGRSDEVRLLDPCVVHDREGLEKRYDRVVNCGDGTDGMRWARREDVGVEADAEPRNRI